MVKVGSLQYIILRHNNPINSIDNFLDIFLKLDDRKKHEVIFFLSKNKSIDKNFKTSYYSYDWTLNKK
jgi:hypothetical protein